MKNFLCLLSFVLLSYSTYAQNNKSVLGDWYNAEKDAVINIFEAEDQTLSGKIIWMLNPNDENGDPKTDPLNPNQDLRKRSRLGMVMMHGFTYVDNNVWDNGKLYDPKKGKTYTGMITLKDANTLDLRGYIGLSFIGRSSTWTRKLD
tara:strand:+ start:102 stop:542 length:441 start_codon:yes stop_codon:yes gene_type:complete